MEDLNYTVRLMEKDDVPEALEVYRQTGMQEGTHSLYTWLEMDKEAFNIAVKDSGEIIAVCGAVIHPPGFAFIGIYCCLEKYRGRGVGKKVWDACMKHVGTRNASLNAVPEKLEMYRDKGGFPIVETRWTCAVNETENSVNHEALSDQVPDGVTIETFQDAFLPAMLEYDRTLIGYDRKLALVLSCKEVDTQTMVAFKNGNCVGYGTIKISCQKCGLVGPFYADEATVAEVMLRRLIVSLPDAKGFCMMTISSNNSANEFIRKIGCPNVGESIRLYRKETIEIDTKKIFAFWDLDFTPY